MAKRLASPDHLAQRLLLLGVLAYGRSVLHQCRLDQNPTDTGVTESAHGKRRIIGNFTFDHRAFAASIGAGLKTGESGFILFCISIVILF
jgi:hypothetical protein